MPSLRWLLLYGAIVAGPVALIGLTAKLLWQRFIALVHEVGRSTDVVFEAVPDPSTLLPQVPDGVKAAARQRGRR